MNSTFRRVMSFALTLVLTFGAVAPLGNIAYAGANLGGSSTTGGGGQLSNNQGGGFDTHLENLNFRVSVQRTPEFYNDGSEDAKNKVLNNFSYKYPNEWDSEVYFLNHGCVNSGKCRYTDDFSNYRVTKYDSSTGTYKDYRSDTVRKRMFALKNVNTKPSNLYKDALKAYSYHDASKKDIIELANGKWKSIAHSKSPAECLNVWSYILYPTGKGETKLNERMTAYVSSKANGITPEANDSDKEDVALGYLDLLMSMWKINFERKNAATSYWEQAIEDYIRVADPEEKPITIVVDLVGNMKHSNTDPERFLIPMIDYFQLYTGIRSGQDFKNVMSESTVGSAKGNTKSILETLVNKARADHPSSWGSNFSDQWSKSTWNWGASAIMVKGKRFVTYNRKPAHYKNSSAQHAIMESLYLGDDPKGIWGFTAVGFQVNDMAPAEIGFKLIATPDNEMIDYKSEIIGQQVKLNLQVSDIDSKTVNAWESILKRADGGKVNIKLHIKRDGSFSNGKYNFNDGDLIKGVDMPVSSFISMLRGNKGLTWVDDTSQIPIKEAEKKIFNYEVKVEVNWSEGGKTNQWLSTDFADANFDTRDTASFIRPEAPPDPMYYNNYPLQYAEVKEGTPDNETFEAMAGVPSTERLYFGAGGTEFVVDVELEYERDKDSVWRTYHSYYTGTACEHKSGDTSPNKSVGGQSVTVHGGSSHSKTWSGSIPNNASAVTALHNATCAAVPDFSAYNADLAAANAFAAQVAGTVHTHTAVSDGVTRSYSDWNVAVSPSPSPPTDTSASASCSYQPATENSPGTPCGNEMVTASPSGPGSYTITVTWSVPAHILCGPCCLHDLPQINDTWKQDVNIDFLKINKVEVYRLTEGRLTPVNAIFGDGTEELRTESNTTPTIFYNIAQMNAGGDDVAAQSSRHGRLRYTLEPQMHDTVVWNEGVRTNKCDGNGSNGVSGPLGQSHWNTQGIVYNTTGYSDELNYHISNSTTYDKARPEWQKFDERRNLKNNVTVISDVLILQTSSGDKSAIYFTKDGVEITAQEQFADVNATKLEMWDSNPNSAARWSDNEIPIGSYNGNFTRTGKGSGANQKYWGYGYDTKQFYSPQGLGKVATIFDNDPAKTISRPARPGKLYMFRDEQIVPTNQNKLYNTGNATMFYERILNWTCPNPYDDDPYVNAGVQLRPLLYDAQPQGNFGGRIGFVEDAFYSPNHVKVNDIIIHTPVTTENAMIIGLPSDRDQRTETPPGGANSLIEEQNKLKVCPLNPETCDFKVLNCEFLHEKDMLDVDFDSRSGSNLLNKITNEDIPYRIGSGMKIEPKDGFGDGDVLHVTGTRFSLSLADIGIAYDKTLSYLVEMDFYMPTAPTNDGTMVISFGGYGFLIPNGSTVGGFTTNNNLDTRTDSDIVGKPIKLGIQFSFGHILDCKLFINGVEQKNVVKIRDTKITEDVIGDDLNIGSWGKSDNFGGTFYVDNLKVTKASGGSEHSNACYIDTKVHGVIKNHEHTDSCYTTNSNKYACNGLPLNAGGNGSEEFAYTGDVQTFTVPYTSDYTIELWGAEGGTSGYGGKGGYVKGTVKLQKGDVVKVYVGGQTGWNGGGSGHGRDSDSGGGATDIRVNGTSLADRVAVAGGGGGWGGKNTTTGGAGGGLTGGNGKSGCGTLGYGGTQTAGGAGGSNNGGSGSLGQGGSNTTGSNSGGGGGGGGYYGGGAGGNDYSNYNDLDDSSGGGGSSYIGGLTGGTTTAGQNSGNGKAKISWGNGTNDSNNKGTLTFKYTGDVQTFTVPQNGDYTFKLWGAQGGQGNYSSQKRGGYGGYSEGTLTLTKGETLYLYVGGKGSLAKGGFNGGGNAGANSGGGGGATDIRTTLGDLNSRLIVAGGGGGAEYDASSDPTNGQGGGLSGTKGLGDKPSNGGNPGTQTSGGIGPGGNGSFGQGGHSTDDGHSAGGGGGYYGGAGGAHDGDGGGGSGYIAPSVKDGVTQLSNHTGNGEIIINWTPEPEELHHQHTADCPKVTGKSLICGYDSELNVITEKNSHVHDGRCGTYNGWGCYNLPLNTTKAYTCNNLPLNDAYSSTENVFNYTGAKQTYVAPADATYILEVWGAQGTSKNAAGGLGGYSKGEIKLKKGDTLNLYVGGCSGTSAGGWNGGGSTGGSAGGGGGGTDIRLGGDALTDRIIVAGGGGGAQAGYGGAGGGLVGGDGQDKLGDPGLGGTQTLGGKGGGNQGVLGQGGNGVSGSDGCYGGAGGGGYYGGGGASSDHSLVDDSGGGGGSGYIGGVTNGITQAGVQSGNGKIVITSPSVATAHKHTDSCSYEYTEHKHDSSCTTVKEYSCGGQVKNAHTDVTDYTGGNRTYGAFENVGGKKLTTTGVQTAEGAYRIGGNQTISGPGDEYYAGTYLVTLRGKDVHNANIVVRDDKRNFAISKLNTENPTEVKYILGVTDKTDNLNFNISTNIGVIEISEIFVEPITIREPIGLCPTCKKHVTLKSGGTKVQCSECSTDLFDFEEKINFMSSTLNNADGDRQITIFGAGNKVGVLRVDNGYKINEDLSTKPDRNFEPYFKYDKAFSKGCEVVSELACTEPHHNNSHYDGGNDICWDACGVDENHKLVKDEVIDPNTGTVNHNATFINLDYGFRMYFPNRGDFAEDTSLKGITAPTSTRGQGYIDDMPTTKYTERKSVTFEFNVIHKGVLYLAGERIDLTVEEEYFDFYCVLANREAVSASVEWEAVAINGRPIGDVQNDNYGAMSNKRRYGDFTALHGGYKQTWIDVVGRIGNFTISDTDDFRFSNFFKEPDVDNGWLIEGILPNVRQDVQNEYYGDLVDIRGEKVSEDTNFLNTYGSQKWLEQQPVAAPINPKDNPVNQLREKFMRVGYDIYGDITTIGDYQDGMIRALPYYYFIDIDTNSVIPLDVYMKENDTYMLINQYASADNNTIAQGIYHQNMIMNWEKEATRRNYMIEESLITDRLADLYREPVVTKTVDEDGNTVEGITGWKDMARPKGNYTYQGIAQRYVLDSTSKTYIGSSQTYGEEMNIGGLIAENVWEDNAQRWHLKFGLPSSAVFVETGKEATQENIDDILNRNGVVLNAMDIISIGKTYTLRWQQPGISSFTIETGGNKKTYNIKNLGLPPVIALYEAGKTSVDDITISGTH